MLGQYAALAKWIIIVGLIGSIVYAIDDHGYQRASKRYETQLQEQQKKAEKMLNDAKQEVAVKTAESNASATFISEEYNAKVDEIKQLKDDNSSLISDASKLRQKSLCRRSGTSAVSDSQNTKVHDSVTRDDETGFSDEFKQFLESQERRDKLNEAWAESTVKRIQALCKEPGIECEK